MYQHVFLIYSDYSEEKRIAVHRCYETAAEMYEFIEIASEIKDKFKQLTFSFHHIQTMESDTNSIAEYDKYFTGIEYYSDIEEFIDAIEQDTIIKPIDVAKIILSKKDLSNLELEKMLYFSYCEYMKLYGDAAFSEEFEAWQYGPVMPEIYHELKSYGRKKIRVKDTEQYAIKLYSKLIKFADYEKIIKAVDAAIERYGSYTTGQLIEKSHEKDSPWDKVFNSDTIYKVIPKELIQKYVLEGNLNLV